jgi:hypothetical protein
MIITDLLAAASPLPWARVKVSIVKDAEQKTVAAFFSPRAETRTPESTELAVRMVNALPAVLEYMKHEHHRYCAVVQQELWKKTWQLQQTIKRDCTCGYDALRDALGTELEGNKK